MSVYFAQVGPVVKIGYSANPERRVANLFKGSTLYSAPAVAIEHRDERHLLRAIDGDKNTERQIHLALSDFNVGLEWFVAEQPILDFAATVQEADEYEPLHREGGRVRWADRQMAGGNVELVMAAFYKRRERQATTQNTASSPLPPVRLAG